MKLKLIIMTILSILWGQCGLIRRTANEDLLSICRSRTSENTLIVDYMDSTHGISKITQSITRDTLKLDVFVAIGKEQKGHEIKYDSNTKFISTGKKTFEIAKIKVCGDIKSGKEALDDLRNLK